MSSVLRLSILAALALTVAACATQPPPPPDYPPAPGRAASTPRRSSRPAGDTERSRPRGRFGQAGAHLAAMLRLILLTTIALIASPPTAEAACPERPPCHGCKGGTGYRGPDKRCVGFRNFEQIGGAPPHVACIFENAPGTGENRDCALAPRDRKKSRPPDTNS